MRTRTRPPAYCIGIDPSLTATGIAVRNAVSGELTYWTITCGKRTGPERLDYLDGQFGDILARFPYRMVALEGYSFGNRFTRDHDLGELGGLIKLRLYRLGLPTLIAPPNSLKLFLTGDGAAKKAKMKKTAEELYGLKCDNDNEADALGLVHMAEAKLTGRFSRAHQHLALDGCSVLPVRDAK